MLLVISYQTLNCFVFFFGISNMLLEVLHQINITHIQLFPSPLKMFTLFISKDDAPDS